MTGTTRRRGPPTPTSFQGSTLALRRKARVRPKRESSGILCLCITLAVICLFVTPIVLLEAGLQAQRRQRGATAPLPLEAEEHISYNEGDQTKYHVVFSTDCTEYQNFQSYILFYHAEKIGQPGTITRIVSGCTAKQEMMLEDFHLYHVATISRRFKIHFTPNYMRIDGDVFPYYNKPFGVKHWMEHSLGFPQEDDDDAVIILIDPDMIPLRPLTRSFANGTDRWLTDQDIVWTLKRGLPVAQRYLLSPRWRNWNLTKLLGSSSAALNVTREEAMLHYVMGPPYIATSADMWQIVSRWTQLCSPVKEVYPDMLAEMYAYILAVADLGLPHQISTSMMWSDPRVQYTEPWDWVEDMEPGDLCRMRPTPSANFMHYCQEFSFNGFTMYKLRLRHKINKCDHPLLEEPPQDYAANADLTAIHPILKDRPQSKQRLWAERANKREAFATCQLISLINEAMEHHRKHVCKGGMGNVEKTFRLSA